jgi:hypothetical protein
MAKLHKDDYTALDGRTYTGGLADEMRARDLRDPQRIADALTVPGLVTTEPERRQIARSLQFDARTAFAIDWNKIAQTARELGAHFEARSANDGAVVVTMFWAYDADEDGAL